MREEFSTHGQAVSRARRKCARGGFTMIEVSLALTVLVVALVATTASNLRMQALRRSNHDRVAAQNAVQSIAERVQAIGRAGTSDASGFAPHVVAALSAGGDLGATFDVPGLTPVAGGAHVGTIRIVTDETASDAAVGAQLGLPRDLDGDGDALDGDVSASAHLLPVVVSVRWHAQSGDRAIVHPFYVFGY
jgi:prepilin-type N-terminal cleavage/methylation domain-containing protein